MSRSGYNDDIEQWSLIRWRGAVESAIRGKRGQAFLYEMLQAMAALPEQKLITEELEKEGTVCALGAVGKARGLDMSKVDPYDHESVAGFFGIPHSLACEIMFWNDEYRNETPEVRFDRMRRWIEATIFEKPSSVLPSEDESGSA